MSFLKTIEDFFECRFDFKGKSVGFLDHFDGQVYWRLLYVRENHFLKIAADPDPNEIAHPMIEVEGFYSEKSSVSPLSGGGTMLVLHPKGVNKPMSYVAITKTIRGHFSLSTTVGCGNTPAEP